MMSAVNPAWIGIVGAAVGGLIVLAGQWLTHRAAARTERRAERRDAYVDFLTVANRGRRLVDEAHEAGEEVDNGREKAGRVLARADRLRAEVDSLGPEADDLRAGAKGPRAGRVLARADILRAEADSLSAEADDVRAQAEGRRAEVDSLRAEADGFLLEMDRALVRMQLASPRRILEAGRYLRSGIDECVSGEITRRELEDRYSTFGSLAYVDLNPTALRWLHRRLLRRYLNRVAGLPHRQAAQTDGDVTPTAPR